MDLYRYPGRVQDIARNAFADQNKNRGDVEQARSRLGRVNLDGLPDHKTHDKRSEKPEEQTYPQKETAQTPKGPERLTQLHVAVRPEDVNRESGQHRFGQGGAKHQLRKIAQWPYRKRRYHEIPVTQDHREDDAAQEKR